MQDLEKLGEETKDVRPYFSFGMKEKNNMSVEVSGGRPSKPCVPYVTAVLKR